MSAVSDEEREAARLKVRAVRAVRLVLVREQEIGASTRAFITGPARSGTVKTHRPLTTLEEEIGYWEAKDLLLERMIALLDQSRAANEALLKTDEDLEA